MTKHAPNAIAHVDHGPRRARLAIGSLALLALVGCSQAEPQRYPDYRSPTGRVETSEQVHLIHFATDRAELDAAEREALEVFVAGLPRRQQLRAVVVGHADQRASSAYNDNLSSRRAAHVAAALRRSGIDDVVMSVRGLGERYPADPRDNEAAWAANRRVEVRILSDVVTLTRCGDWSYPLGDDPTNGHFAELGCSTRANLERMVANPGDLVRGRDLGPADGIREIGAIQRYHEDRVKAPDAAPTASAP